MRVFHLVALILLLAACAHLRTQLLYVEGIGEIPFEPNCIDYESRRSEAVSAAAEVVSTEATTVAYVPSASKALVFTESTHAAHPSMLEIELVGDGVLMYTASCGGEIEACQSFFAEVVEMEESWPANWAQGNAHGT